MLDIDADRGYSGVMTSTETRKPLFIVSPAIVERMLVDVAAYQARCVALESEIRTLRETIVTVAVDLAYPTP